MQDRIYQYLLLAFLICMILAQAIFAAWPGIDLAVSRLFAGEGGGFPWAGGPLHSVNFAVRRMGEAVALAVVILFLWGLLTGQMVVGELRLWGFVGLNVLLSSGALANGVLKANVGRARPADIVEFGGSAPFTPAFEITEHCTRNCSFVSGEVSLAASLAVPLVVILWNRRDLPMPRGALPLLAMAYVGVVSLLRIGLGRHFLSDAVFAILFSIGTTLVLYPLLGIGAARRDHADLPSFRLVTRGLGRAYAQIMRIERP